MKKVILYTALFIGSVIAFKANAQVSIGVNVSIGNQPQWGPAGYNDAQYYYLPDIDMYYYVPAQQFVYIQNGQWIFDNRLPVAYRNFDLYNCYKVVVNQPRPYMNAVYNRQKYACYKGWNHPQPMWRDVRNNNYYYNQNNRNYDRRNSYPAHNEVYRTVDNNKWNNKQNNNWNNNRGRDNRNDEAYNNKRESRHRDDNNYRRRF